MSTTPEQVELPLSLLEDDFEPDSQDYNAVDEVDFGHDGGYGETPDQEDADG